MSLYRSPSHPISFAWRIFSGKPRRDPYHLFPYHKFMPSHYSSAKIEVRPSSIIIHTLHPIHRNSMAPKQPWSFTQFSSSCWNLLLLLLLILSASSLPGISLKRPHLLLTIRRVKINSIDCARHLVEANVVKSLEACTIDLAHPVIWHQKLLFPAHKHVFTVCAVLIMEIGLLGLLCKRPPRGEARPVLHVLFVAGAPVIVTGLEGVLWTNNFAFEESSESSVFRC